MSSLRLLVIPSVLLLCSAAAHSLSAQPFFVGIGTLDGVGTSITTGVSATGLVSVGDSDVDRYYPSEAIRWSLNNGITSLTPGRHSDASNGAANGTGSVLTGGFIGNSTRHAFRWTAETGAVSIGDLDGGRFRSIATGVSAHGGIIVGVGGSDNSDWEAFRWTDATGMVGLGDLPGGKFSSSATAISADGLVIVGGSSSTDTGGEAFRWTEETGMVGLGDLPGGEYNGTATCVSAEGSVVVGYSWATDGQISFRWTEATGMVELEKIHPNQWYLRAFGTSWDGNVIVGESHVGGGGGSGAFYWTAKEGTRWLTDVLAEHGVVVPEGWHLSSAFAVSADGRTIVGNGSNPQGYGEGWVAYLGPGCRADYDENGTVDAEDVAAYITAWLNRSIFTDWDYDGSINTRDLLGFLNEWVAKPGCD